MRPFSANSGFFFFNDTATPEISTLPLHAALPISLGQQFPNHLEELARFERLDQRARRAQSRRGLQHLDLSGPAPTRHGDDRRLGLLATKGADQDRKSTRLNSSHGYISYAVFCLEK